MRRGELLALRWKDIDLEKALLYVRSNLQFIKGGFVFSDPKTPLSRRQVALSQKAVEALRRHQAHQNVERRLLGEAWDDSFDLVLPNSIGRPENPSNLLSHQLYPLLKSANIPEIRFHDLRHTAATLLLEAGIHPKVVSEMLGHSHISITLGIYSHVTPDMHKAAAAAMNAMLEDPAS